jgi:hypothetical protein
MIVVVMAVVVGGMADRGRHYLKRRSVEDNKVGIYLPPSCHLYQKQMDSPQSLL